MALVTGDECGLLKLADLHRNTATRIDENEAQARSRGILKIATSAVDATTGAATFHAARKIYKHTEMLLLSSSPLLFT